MFLPCFFPLTQHFMMLMFAILMLQVTTAKAPIPSLNVHVAGEGEQANLVEVLLLPELECLELPLPPTFQRISVLLTLLSCVKL